MANSITTIKQIRAAITENSPSILTGFGVAGLFGSVFFAVDAAKKAQEIIQKERDFRDEEYGYGEKPITLEENILMTWELYVPTALMMITTAGCIIGSNHINRRRS